MCSSTLRGKWVKALRIEEVFLVQACTWHTSLSLTLRWLKHGHMATNTAGEAGQYLPACLRRTNCWLRDSQSLPWCVSEKRLYYCSETKYQEIWLFVRHRQVICKGTQLLKSHSWMPAKGNIKIETLHHPRGNKSEVSKAGRSGWCAWWSSCLRDVDSTVVKF